LVRQGCWQKANGRPAIAQQLLVVNAPIECLPVEIFEKTLRFDVRRKVLSNA